MSVTGAFLAKDYTSGRLLPSEQSNSEGQIVTPTNTNLSSSVGSTSTALKLEDSLVGLDNSKAVMEKSTQKLSFLGVTNLTASMIIMALLAIPMLLVIFVAVFVRLKKQGKYNALVKLKEEVLSELPVYIILLLIKSYMIFFFCTQSV